MNEMKKLLSLLCVLTIVAAILAVGVVSASADVPTTEIDVKSGDKVSYSLSLSGVPERIVGCDFSVYYDSSAFSVDSVADFNDNTNDEDWQATINPDLNGEVRGNWSILRGVDFSGKRNIVTLNMTAKKDASAHVSYFVRYMYDESVFDSDDRPQIDQYMFTCDVTVNGKAVAENAQPELNVEEEQPNGLFPNSRTGKSEDANTALTGDSIKENGGAVDDISAIGNNDSGSNNGNNAGNNSNNANNSGNKSNSANNNSKSADNKKATEKAKGQANTPNEGSTKAAGDTVQTDAEGKIVQNTAETVAATAKKEGKSSSTLMWVIIAAVVVIAGGCIAFVAVKGKKGATAEKPADNNAPQNEDDQQ